MPFRLAVVAFILLAVPAWAADPPVIRSARSGPWSAADSWEGGRVPAAGARVLVRTRHTVVYDVRSAEAIRAVHVSGTLSFAPDRFTLLAVGLLKVQPGENTAEEGFDCDAHLSTPKEGDPKPALEVGTPDQPIEARYTATIRLTYFEGMDKESCPAVVCCGGRMDFHGQPMARTWVKLGRPAKADDTGITL